MKKILILSFVLSVGRFLSAQTHPNDILGKWLSESGKAKIEVFESGNKYYGKIYWLKNPNDEQGNPKLDKRNPNPEKQKLKILGLLLLKSLEFDGKSEWHNGTIYDPENGKEYKCKVTKDPNGNLDIRGYIGVSMLGRTTVWKRTE